MKIQIRTDEAIDYAGNKNRLAKLLGIRRQSLTTWGEYVPKSSAWKLYLLTDRELGVLINEESYTENIRPSEPEYGEDVERELVSEAQTKAEIFSMFSGRKRGR